MDKSRLIGRSEEIATLLMCQDSPKSEFVAVYGRRRVGKTFLLKETLGSILDFEFSGMYNVSGKTQLKQFVRTLNKHSAHSDSEAKDWFDAFDLLREYLLSLHKEKVTVFLDELPWMDTAKSHFLTALSAFWNNWSTQSPLLKLYVCGSATTWMIDKLIGDRGGLYGRISRPVYLAPFSLRETEQFLNEIKHMGYGPKQVIDTYMILGGIPYYLDMLDPDLPLTSNIDRLFFSPNAPLKTEYEFLFRSLFKQNVQHRRIIELLATRLSGLTRDEISAACGFSGGELTKTLKNLNSCDFIRSYNAPHKKERDRMYQLTDLFSLFHLRFIQKGEGQDEHFWTNLGQTGQKTAWAGYAFEQVCLHHIPQIKNKLGISGILSNAYAWSCKAFIDQDGNEWRGGQIDLVIDRNDQVINLCEMKYVSGEYIIDKDYADIIHNRTELFRRVMKTKKDLRCVFITPYGVKKNLYSQFVNNQITAVDLFQ